MIRAIDKQTRDVVAASYVLPDLPTAVREVVYNALDAGATSIRVFVSVESASFSVMDNGEGIAPDDLCQIVGEHFASSRVMTEETQKGDILKRVFYGEHGETLYSLVSLAASVEIESRTPESWTSHRKVFQLGEVTLNTRARDVRATPGSTIKIGKLFHRLSVRQRDLAENASYRARVMSAIREFLANISLIWPLVAFEVKFQHSLSRSISIPAVRSSDERIRAVFGDAIGRKLQEVNLELLGDGVTVQGFATVIPDEWGSSSPGIKQAKAYYQFVFFDWRWVGKYHRQIANAITQTCIESGAGVPIFLLNVALSDDTSLADQVPDTLKSIADTIAKAFAGSSRSQRRSVYSKRIVTSEQISSQDGRGNWLDKDAPCDNLTEWQTVHVGDVRGLPCRETNRLQDEMDEASLAHYGKDLTMSSQSDTVLAMNSLHQVGDPSLLVADSDLSDEYENAENHRSYVCHACGMMSASSSAVQDIQRSSEAHEDFKRILGVWNREATVTSDNLPSEAEALPQSTHLLGLQRGANDHHGIFFRADSPSVFSQQNHSSNLSFLERQQTEPWISSCSLAVNHPEFTSSRSPSGDMYDDGRASTLTATTDVFRCHFDPESTKCCKQSLDREVKVSAKVRTSNFFRTTKHQASKLRQRADLTMSSMSSFTNTIQVQGFHERKSSKSIKLHKSVLDRLTFVRQVDRKFIVVTTRHSLGTQDSNGCNLLLCIDQHAADERVRLEKLELELFGTDGRSRNIDIHEHDPAIILQVNALERRTMEDNDALLRSWRFDFERCSRGEWDDGICENVRGGIGGYRFMLRASPKIEKQITNADDFREFVQVLATNPSYTSLSTLRPPAITRLLHSRACRSAIMFGDFLSIDQCKTLLNDLRKCQLPFQCAHGRPSVVPLAEFQGTKMSA